MSDIADIRIDVDAHHDYYAGHITPMLEIK
jgi:hypothetical protein